MQNRYLLFVTFFIALSSLTAAAQTRREDKNQLNTNDPAYMFNHPPDAAKPGVLWMWMGSNVSKQGITKDLEALKQEGFNSTTVSTLADVTIPWAAVIQRSPTPQIIGWTEPWWKLMRYAADESKRLGMTMNIYNCPGYEASGGPWITPDLSMQEVCWSVTKVNGNSHVDIKLNKPTVNPRADMRFPVSDTATGKIDYPDIAGRSKYYKDIAVLAMPATGIVSKDSIIDLTAKMDTDGRVQWNAPPGNWVIYRFGHTTTGALIQPAQPQATGLECDKMNVKAVSFQMDHMIGEIKRHMGGLVGTTVTGVFFDSYEIDDVTWTPKMKEEFMKRRGYDIIPYLATFAGRTIGSKADSLKFVYDFDNTVRDLYRDVYFKVIAEKLKAAHLNFLSEPYGGPWRQDDVIPQINHPMVEFWTDNGVYTPYLLAPTLAAIRKTGQNMINAEAFTGQPAYSKWDEYPAWLKPIGDMAFCVGVNHIIIHRFVEQPWDGRYMPGEAMGQWGTHFDRTQTWWKPAAATVKYWQRCQALLQWGKYAVADSDFVAYNSPDGMAINHTHRKLGNINIFFVANTTHNTGPAYCSFKVTGMQPELWDPVTGDTRDLLEFNDNGRYTFVALDFDDAQSFFIVFRHKYVRPVKVKQVNFPEYRRLVAVNGTWQVQFDPRWGGPAQPVDFTALTDWTKNADTGIKYFSGTAVYHINFDVPGLARVNKPLYLDLGQVKYIAHVYLNNTDLGVVWTAPWGIRLPVGLLKNEGNSLRIEVTNVWANRLIGDEQQPDDCEWLPSQYIYNSGRYLKEFPDWFLKNEPRPSPGRYCFTTWDYFTKDSPLVPSGLMGPVQVLVQE